MLFSTYNKWISKNTRNLVHQPKCNCLVTNKSLVMTFSISNTLFQPPPVGHCVNDCTHFPVFIPFPTKEEKKDVSYISYDYTKRFWIHVHWMVTCVWTSSGNILKELNPFISDGHLQTVIKSHTTILYRNAECWHSANLRRKINFVINWTMSGKCRSDLSQRVQI